MAGKRPVVEITRGIVTLHRRESWLSLVRNPHYRSFPPQARAVSISVGATIDSMVKDGDVFGTGRDGCGELSVRIFRKDTLLAAFGAVARTDLRGHATVEEDPRALARSPTHAEASRPTDPWLRIGVDGESSLVREGEYVLRRPWHLFVQRVFRYGLPGYPSQLAIVREHPSITREDVIETTRALASPQFRLK